MVNIPALIATENRRWNGVIVATARHEAFARVAARLVAPQFKIAYQEIEALTRVPWFVVAVIHEREASQNFALSLAQGDPWNAVSRHVPKGRGPFKSFQEAALDALMNCAPKAGRWTDWSIGGVLTILEEYNGLGYASKGVPSPYDWAGTNQYVSGKYVRDGFYDPAVVDAQLGCAGLLIAMSQVDASIKFGTAPANSPVARLSPGRPVVPVVPSIHDAPPLRPSITNPAAGSIGAVISGIFRALFSAHHA